MRKFIIPWLVAILLISAAPASAEEKTAPSHDVMDRKMQDMQKEIDKLKNQEHCMPNMTAHCQMIANLTYMESRMAHMKTYMQFCVQNQGDCEMPEMVGEMKALNRKIGEMTREMQDIADKAPSPGNKAQHLTGDGYGKK